MSLRGIVKCANIFFVIFLMCPKPSRLSAPIGKQQEYFHAVRKSLNEVNDPSDMKLVPAHWSTDIIKNDQGDEKLLGIDDEPGFDISDEEIRKFKLWPKGIIPYYIDVLSFNDKVLRDRIRLFLNVINSVTRISFLEMPSPPKDETTRWVFFVNRRGQLGCADHSIMNFTNEGVQHVVLGYDCMSTGGELAEAVLSIAGVPPQHNAPNRDEFIKVMDENILPEKKFLFQKLNSDQWLFYDIKYDFSSAGHFHYHKHSVNGRATIITQPLYSGISMGENNGFTISDIAKLRMLYNYIVKKKEDKVPECDRLFMPGPNFKHRRPIIPDKKPRKKPYQYLGLSEELAETDKHGKGSGNDDQDYSIEQSRDDSNYDENTKGETDDEEKNLKYFNVRDPYVHIHTPSGQYLKRTTKTKPTNRPTTKPPRTHPDTESDIPDLPDLPNYEEENLKGGGGIHHPTHHTKTTKTTKGTKGPSTKPPRTHPDTERDIPDLPDLPNYEEENLKGGGGNHHPTHHTKTTKTTKGTKGPSIIFDVTLAHNIYIEKARNSRSDNEEKNKDDE